MNSPEEKEELLNVCISAFLKGYNYLKNNNVEIPEDIEAQYKNIQMNIQEKLKEYKIGKRFRYNKNTPIFVVESEPFIKGDFIVCEVHNNSNNAIIADLKNNIWATILEDLPDYPECALNINRNNHMFDTPVELIVSNTKTFNYNQRDLVYGMFHGQYLTKNSTGNYIGYKFATDKL